MGATSASKITAPVLSLSTPPSTALPMMLVSEWLPRHLMLVCKTLARKRSTLHVAVASPCVCHEEHFHSRLLRVL